MGNITCFQAEKVVLKCSPTLTSTYNWKKKGQKQFWKRLLEGNEQFCVPEKKKKWNQNLTTIHKTLLRKEATGDWNEQNKC